MTLRIITCSLLFILVVAGGVGFAAGFTDPATGMEFVLVKGGCFEMGEPKKSQDNDVPVQETCVDDFYIGKYEVTQAQYLQVVGNKSSDYQGLCPDCPVVNVTYDDTKNFINILSRESQLHYRLPYEDEWEFAARSKNASQRWPGTNDPAKLSDYAWYADNSEGRYQPVGKKRPNQLGVHDLSGNVAEWCEDVYFETYGDPQTQPDDELRRTVRGGSWRSAPQQLRSTARAYLKPVLRPVHKATNGKYDVDLGFRVVLPAENLRLKKLYLNLADKDGAKVAEAIRKLKNKNLSAKGQGELLLTAISLMPGQSLTSEIEALIKTGADVNIRNEQGITPLIMLFDRVLGKICCDKAQKEHGRADNLAYKLASLLIESGADVNARDASGRTAISLAAGLGASQSVALLIENQANVNLRDRKSQTPLMQACKSSYEYVPKTPDGGNGWDDEEILVPGIRKKYEEIARMLKQAGAEASVKDAHGKTALDYARERDNEKLVAMITKIKR